MVGQVPSFVLQVIGVVGCSRTSPRARDERRFRGWPARIGLHAFAGHRRCGPSADRRGASETGSPCRARAPRGSFDLSGTLRAAWRPSRQGRKRGRGPVTSSQSSRSRHRDLVAIFQLQAHELCDHGGSKLGIGVPQAGKTMKGDSTSGLLRPLSGVCSSTEGN